MSGGGVGGDKVGFGIIGAGLIADIHARAVRAIPEARLEGIFDVSQVVAERFAGRYEIRSFPSMNDLLACPEIDVVCICTPSGLHAPIALDAIRAGKHVVVEKPMAIRMEDCDAIISESHRMGLEVAVISQLRFNPSIVRTKEAIEGGRLGRLIMASLSMKYYRTQQYYDSSNWKGTWAMDGGGALMNQGIHGIDLLLMLMGPACSVSGNARTLARKIEVEDTLNAVVEFSNGALGTIEAATSVFPGSPRKLEINGSCGTIALEEASIVKWEIEGDGRPLDFDLEHTNSSSFSDPAAISIEGHVSQLQNMIQAIRGEMGICVGPPEGRNAVELVLAIYKASQEGRVVHLG